MDKRLGLGACLLGIVLLHAYIFSSTESNFSRTNTVNNSRQKQSNPKYSGVIFAGTEANLIPPIDKKQRQAMLDATVNPLTNAGRDPFAAIPGTFVAPPPDPAPVQAPLPEFRPTPPPPPQVVPVPQVKVAPPPALEAQEIKITGAMEIGGKTYAIVSVPGSSSSQYVSEGERLAGSKVLVKSIDLSDRPLVILEQNNAEFTHTIDQS